MKFRVLKKVSIEKSLYEIHCYFSVRPSLQLFIDMFSYQDISTSFQRLKKANILSSIQLNRKITSTSSVLLPFLIYGNTKVFIDKNAIIRLKTGTIDFNCGARHTEPLSGYLEMLYKSELIITDTVEIYAGAHIIIGSSAQLTLAGGFINRHIKVRCFREITIGKGTAISENVMIWDTDAHEIIREGYRKSAPVIIGERVWIGANVTILIGVHIGDGASIGAGAVVNSDIPSECLAVGNPARVVRENVSWR